MDTEKNLPNSTAVLVLGIISIVFCSFIGLVTGIIALSLSAKDLRLYADAPTLYSPTSLSQLKAGRTCAIIGVCISAAVTLFTIIYLIFWASLFALFISNIH